MANRPHIDGLATHAQQHQPVKLLKDFDARLVDGDHDSAAVAGDVAYRRHDGACAACVQAAGRLIQKLQRTTPQ